MIDRTPRFAACLLAAATFVGAPAFAADPPAKPAAGDKPALAPGPNVGTAKPLGDKPADVKLEPVFNGKDTAGWVTKAPDLWSVKDGVLVGESTDPKSKGDIMRLEKSPANFALEAEVRYPDNIDSGFMWGKPEIQVQFGVSRSLKVDMSGSLYYGGKYPEPARAKVAGNLKLGEWNTWRIEHKDGNVKVWLNGTHVLNWDAPKAGEPAPIGVQIHGGVVMKVEFKSIKVGELK
ncbi:MAG TPA: DUF1080 domain-containing protein [Tepidisphaeraceae bacterium]|nr:DUF1080 domain-containing protein [Tepidisphaeraceae bacterium]